MLVSYDPRTVTAASKRPFSSTAVISLVIGILGHLAMSRIRRRNGRGMGIAIAGITVGWAITALWLVALALSPQGVLEIYEGYGDFFTALLA